MGQSLFKNLADHNAIMSLGSYIKETKGEMRHVNWPTRRQAVALTAIVIVLSLMVGVYLGFFDFVFNLILRIFIL